MTCRLEAEVLSGQLWHKECQERNANLPDDIPLSFPSADAYVRTFEPLLFEEARESVRGDWAEACEGPRARVWPARVGRYTSYAIHNKFSPGSVEAGTCAWSGLC